MVAIMYMVAGMSSRFGGKIKQFAQVGPNGERLIEYSLKQAFSEDITQIIFIVGKMTKEPFYDIFGDHYQGIPVTYAEQTFDQTRDRPWGTVDAVCAAVDLIDQPCIICNGDDLYGEDAFKQIVDELKHGNNVTVGYELQKVVPETGTVNRGVYKVERGHVKEIEEKLGMQKPLSDHGLTGTELASMNLFGLQPEIIQLLNQRLLAFKKEHALDREIECLLPKELTELIKQGKLELAIKPTTATWYGVTRPEDVEEVRNKIKNLS